MRSFRYGDPRSSCITRTIKFLEECKRSAYMKSRNGRTMLQLSLRYAENSKALEHL